MLRSILTSLLFCVITEDQLFGQELPPIQLDRPDQTECPFIVPKKYIQVEHGFTFERIDANQKQISHPTSLIKYGCNKNVELRLIAELVSQSVSGHTDFGIAPITLGFKSALFEEKGILPKTSFIGHITTSNIGSSKFHTTYIAPAFRFTMQHTLTKKMSLAYNLGCEWNGESAAQTYIYTLTTGVALTEKLGFYAELYGFLPKDNSADHRFDLGFTNLMSNNIMIDLSGGVGLTSNAPKGYMALGISYRFKAFK